MFQFKPKWLMVAEPAPVIGMLPVEDNYRVPYTSILRLENHPNADRLELAYVYGFQVIVQKGKYKIGDPIIYIPIDSILPPWLESQLFPVGSKITLHNNRVRQIKIRGIVSQGMLVDPADIVSVINPQYLKSEQNLTAILGITKYEPPVRGEKFTAPKLRDKPLENPRFHQYGGIDNVKWYPNYFDGQEVIIQEKLHGSNCRAGISRTAVNTLWKKIKNFFGFLPKYEFCYGSNRVQLQERGNYTGYYGSDIYGATLKRCNIAKKLKPGETVFGEIIGPGIQKNYEYGLTEHHFVLFDVKVEKEDGTQEYLDPEEAEAFAIERGIDFVPVLYRGIFNAEMSKSLSSGPSEYDPNQKVREGVVIKVRKRYSINSSKQALKSINEDYLADTNNTDFH